MQGNGVGVLRDAVSCTVTEERNGAFELEMIYPITGQHYSSLALRGLILAKPNPYSEAQYFRIYKISRPIGGQVTVNAQHISYDLSGVPVGPCKALNAVDALQQLKSHAAVNCDYSFWTDIQTVADFAVTVPGSLRSLLGGVEGSVLDVYGGEYEWDNTTVKLHSQRGTDRGVTIRYGKNLTDLTQEESCAEVYTGVYPYWVDSHGNVTQITGNPVVNVPDGSYDFERVLTLDVSQDIKEQPTAAQLRQAALDYISANKVGVPKVSLTLSFAQLEQTAEYADMALLERVGLCDTVHVQFAKLGVSADARCIKTVYDVLLERYDSVELGDARSSLANTVADMGKTVQSTVNKTRSDLERAIDRATQLITGNLGGYVVLHSSTGADEPDEILVMDKPEIEKATRVWRWNLAGWGYSSSGYGGPYRLAATMDGAINADFITTGSLSANLIKSGMMSANLIRGGVLQSTNGKFVSNLDTGVTTFNGGLVVNSDNFNIGSDGSVDITGKFTSTVSESKCVIDDARIEMYRKTNDGNWHMGAFMSAWGSNNAVGRLVLCGPAASNPNDMIPNVTIAGQYDGGAIAISNASGDVKVQLGVDGAGDGYVLVNGRMIQ
ncbi:phage tail spike protein [uncultured Gemmiger sp.]|uniref:phage tail spike protein n=1 Tax=uncultured Gemmiger sp. TaxID=1623490 RepID=UPI00266BFBE9|nr:phage tail spike protein [uncultured Gemmiger sp.]